MTLKKAVLLLAVFGFLSAFPQKKVLNLQIVYFEPYCGGARPSEEMQKQAETAKPYAGKRIIIVSQSGKIRCTKTNSSGYIKVKLKMGKYRVMEEWRYYKQIPYKLPAKDLDMDCLKLEWEKELYTVKVDSEKAEALPKNNIVVECPWNVPCLLESARPPVPQ